MNELRAMLLLYSHGLWRLRWLVLAVAWTACLAGWIFIMALPDRYTVPAKVQVDADRLLAPLLREIMGQTDPDQDMIKMQADILSRPALVEIATRAGLVPTDASEARRDAAAQAIAGHIHAFPSDQNVMNLSYQDTDPWRAQRVTEAAVDTLVERNLAAARRQTDKALRFVDSQITSYERRLAEAEARLETFRRLHGNEVSDAETAARRQQELIGEVQEIDAEQKAKMWLRDRIRAEIRKTPEWVTEAQLGTGDISAQQQYIFTLQQRLNALTQIYTDKYPDVATLKAQIADAERQETQASRRSTRKSDSARVARNRHVPNPVHQRLQQDELLVESQLVGLQQRGLAAHKSLAALDATIKRLPDLERQTTQLNRDYSIIRAAYAKMIERRENIRLAQNMAGQKSAVAFAVIGKPKFPAVPSGPNRPLFFIVVALCAIAIGTAAGLARLMFSGLGIHSVGALRSIADRPVLGMISQAKSRQPLRTAASLSAFGGAVLMLFIALGGLVYTYKFTPLRPTFDILARTALLGFHRTF